MCIWHFIIQLSDIVFVHLVQIVVCNLYYEMLWRTEHWALPPRTAFIFYFFEDWFIYFGGEWGVRGRGRESQADSRWARSLTRGTIPGPRSWSEPTSSVRLSTDWATQAPPETLLDKAQLVSTEKAGSQNVDHLWLLGQELSFSLLWFMSVYFCWRDDN